MSWFSDIISGGTSDLIDSVGDAFDKNITNDEEREALKLAIRKELNSLEKKIIDAGIKKERELTQRLKLDIISDNILSKNIRPAILIFLTLSDIFLAVASIFFLDPNKIELVKPWITLLTSMTVSAYSFYFGGRSIEKFGINNKLTSFLTGNKF